MTLVADLLETRGFGRALPSARAGFDLAEAYKVAHQIAQEEIKTGKTLVGRKIGISNRAAWSKMGLSDVVWGYLYRDTVFEAESNQFELSLEGLSQPKLEPEIVFGLSSSVPTGTRDPKELIKAVAWMALGFEVVQCPYPDWVFKPADLVATFGFHGALIIGEKVPVNPDMAHAFAACQAVLKKNGETVAEGGGNQVVDSPLVALGHIADLIAADGASLPLKAGELITTGTLTAAPAISAGETYEVTVTGLGLPKLRLELI